MNDNTEITRRAPASVEKSDQDTAVAIVDKIKEIASSVNKGNAREVLEKVKDARKLLEALRVAHEQMCEFAECEALLYVHIATSVRCSLKKGDEYIINWIRELTDEGRACVIKNARSGRPIHVQYKDDGERRRREQQQNDAEWYFKKSLREFENNGKVSISYDDCMDNMTGQNTEFKRIRADATVSRLRTRLLQRNAVCVGDGEYINVDHIDSEKLINNAIYERVKQVIRDIAKIEELSHKTGGISGFLAGYLKDEANRRLGEVTSNMVVALFETIGTIRSEA